MFKEKDFFGMSNEHLCTNRLGIISFRGWEHTHTIHRRFHIQVCACVCRCANITANSCADSFICVISVLNTIITISFNGSFDFHHPNEMNWFSVIHAYFHSSHHQWTRGTQRKGKVRLFRSRKKETNKQNKPCRIHRTHTFHRERTIMDCVWSCEGRNNNEN